MVFLTIFMFIELAHQDWIFEQMRRFSLEDPMEASDFGDICSYLSAGSTNPLISCLRVAQMCSMIAGRYSSMSESYMKLNERFTNAAISLISSVENDCAALLILDKRDEFSRNAIQIALKSKNVKFLGCPRVAMLLDKVWSTPKVLVKEEKDSLLMNLLKSPMEIFLLPKAKYYWKMFSYFLFVLTFTVCYLWTATYEVNYGVLSVIITMSWIYALGEIRVMKDLKSKYFKLSNFVGFPIYVLTIMLVIVSGAKENLYIFVSFLPLIVYARIFQYLRTFVRFGGLYAVIVSTIQHILSVGFMVIIIILAFTFSLWLVIGPGVPGYTELYLVAESLIQGAFGQVDLSPFAYIDAVEYRYAAKAIYVLFILITNLLLLNVFIAILSAAFTKGFDRSVETYYFSKADIIWEYDSHHTLLIPPFSLFSSTVRLIMDCCCCCLFKKKHHPAIGEAKWLCSHCLSENTYDGQASRDALLKRLDEVSHDSENACVDSAGLVREVLYPTPESCKNLCEHCLRVNPEMSRIMREVIGRRQMVEYYIYLITQGLVLIIVLCLYEGLRYIVRRLTPKFFSSTGLSRTEEVSILNSISEKSLTPSADRSKLAKLVFTCTSNSEDFTVKDVMMELRKLKTRLRFSSSFSGSETSKGDNSHTDKEDEKEESKEQNDNLRAINEDD
jgi:hypothetical protein